MAKVGWTQLFDDNDNTYYEAPSPYTDDGSNIMWRLRQRLMNDRVEWYEDHDSELMDPDGPESWRTLKQAKVAIQKAHDNIIAIEV